MLIALAAAAFVALPQALPQAPDSVFRDSAFGVTIARPGPDWVLEPARTRGTTTVIFSPRRASLSEQLWGALVLTRIGRTIRLGEVADQRVTEAWQPTLGPTFQLLTRDSLTVAGLPAYHIVMAGTIGSTPLDIEEYLLARGTDLILLQLRYPHAMARDSIALAYDRVLSSLVVRGGAVAAATSRSAAPPAAAPASTAAPPAAPAAAAGMPGFIAHPRRELWEALGSSAWRVARVETTVLLETADARLAFAARLDLLNDGLVASDTVPLWLPPGAEVDSLRAAGRPLTSSYTDHGLLVLLPDTVPFQGAAELTVYYRLGTLRRASSFLYDWLPAVESPFDSSGQLRAAADPASVSLRFDLPEGFSAVATGHQSADLAASGRHRQAWTAAGVTARRPGFVVGRFIPVGRTEGRLIITLWTPLYSDAPLDSCARLVAGAWAAYSRAFGSVMAPEVNLVVGAPIARGLPGLVLMTDSAADDAATVRREVARTWWGGAVRGAGPGGAWIEEAWPVWTSRALFAPVIGPITAGDTATASVTALAGANADEFLRLVTAGPEALDSARSAAGDARFREAIRTFAAEHRGGFAAAQDLFSLLR